jgi:ethanolamine utilization protein EutA (predicted chaperonin)
MLLGVKTVDSHPQEVLDLVAAATGDLFQGQNVSAIEDMFKKGRGVAKDNHHYFQEILILSDNLLHVFQRCKKNEDLVVVAVCRISANLGMVLTRSRMHLPKVEAAAG